MAQARVYTTEALTTIATIMRKGESDAVRLASAKEMLERGHGKAPQPQTGADGKGPVEVLHMIELRGISPQ